MDRLIIFAPQTIATCQHLADVFGYNLEIDRDANVIDVYKAVAKVVREDDSIIIMSHYNEYKYSLPLMPIPSIFPLDTSGLTG